MTQALTSVALTWRKRVWLSGLCYHSGKACVANNAREVLAQGYLGGLLKWQLQYNAMLLDSFCMSWHKASGKWNFCDDNVAVWKKEIR